ncbi:MAG: DsrE family protein, partial [Gammaproteobacteria bacterium]|nr:DsrE family protein [Gammaproteobacteria bacterium]
RALDDYDVEKIYVEQESLESRGLTAEDLIIPVEVLAGDNLREIMAQQDVVISS